MSSHVRPSPARVRHDAAAERSECHDRKNKVSSYHRACCPFVSVNARSAGRTAARSHAASQRTDLVGSVERSAGVELFGVIRSPCYEVRRIRDDETCEVVTSFHRARMSCHMALSRAGNTARSGRLRRRGALRARLAFVGLGVDWISLVERCWLSFCMMSLAVKLSRVRSVSRGLSAHRVRRLRRSL